MPVSTLLDGAYFQPFAHEADADVIKNSFSIATGHKFH